MERSDAEWSSRMAARASTGWDLPLVAEVDGAPIGLAWGRIESSNPDVANVYSVWVDPRYRKQGAGKMLMEAIIEWAQSMNARYLELGVAMRIARPCGFISGRL
jgi:GNAT superfamily N-acetyltransferase